MRTGMISASGFLIFVLGSFAWLSFSSGQEPRPAPPASPLSTTQTPANPAVPLTNAGIESKDRASRDLSKLPLLQQQMYLSAQRGADWLFRMNGNDGRFVYGYVPALKSVLEGDHYLRQAGATMALARAARCAGDERYAARARQAVLSLLADTTIDSARPGVRMTALPPIVVNRLAAAGLVVLAINELPNPADDLLEQSEQLCAYIRGQQEADGSLSITEGKADPKSAGGDPEGVNFYPGEALYGLMRSQRFRPAPWKTEVVRNAVKYYMPWWRGHKNMAFVPWQTAAYAEAYLLTQESIFADAVNEMNDWICDLQYHSLDPNHPHWGGGFMTWQDGRAISTPPQIGSASYAEGLAEACRVARKAGDLQRYQRYRETLEGCLQYLARLQYTDANTQHFADWYRPVLLGAFYTSPQDGNIRIDYTQHAVCALLQYLNGVVE